MAHKSKEHHKEHHKKEHHHKDGKMKAPAAMEKEKTIPEKHEGKHEKSKSKKK